MKFPLDSLSSQLGSQAGTAPGFVLTAQTCALRKASSISASPEPALTPSRGTSCSVVSSKRRRRARASLWIQGMGLRLPVSTGLLPLCWNPSSSGGYKSVLLSYLPFRCQHAWPQIKPNLPTLLPTQRLPATSWLGTKNLQNCLFQTLMKDPNGPNQHLDVGVSQGHGRPPVMWMRKPRPKEEKLQLKVTQLVSWKSSAGAKLPIVGSCTTRTPTTYRSEQWPTLAPCCLLLPHLRASTQFIAFLCPALCGAYHKTQLPLRGPSAQVDHAPHRWMGLKSLSWSA